MVRVVAPIVAVLLATLIFQLGNGLISTLLSVRINLLNYPSSVAGLAASAYYVGLVAGALFANRVVALVGHIRAYSALAAIYAAQALVYPIFEDPNVWYALRLTGGFCVAGLFMVIESWLNDRIENEWRGRVLSIYMIVVYAGIGVGQFMLGFDDPLGFVLFSLVAICFALSLVPISLTRWPAPQPPKPAFLNFMRLYRISPLGFLGSFSSGLILGAFYALAPIFAQNLGLDLDQVALLMAAAILGGLVMQFPIGYLSDRTDSRTVLTWSLFAIAVASGAITLAALKPNIAIYLLSGVFFCLSFVIYPLSLGHTNDRVTSEDRMAAIGGLLMVYSVGAAVGPIPAAGLMDLFGDFALFGYTAGVALLTGLFAIWRSVRRGTVPVAEQAPFVALPRTSPVITEFEPPFDEDGGAASPDEDLPPGGGLAPRRDSQ